MNAEEKDILEGIPRVKFECKWKGYIKDTLTDDDFEKFKKTTNALSEALYVQEKYDLAPVLPDGKVGGNGAVKMNLSIGDVLLVSKSGKLPGRMESEDFCIVLKFTESDWSCEYLAYNDQIKPTSDTPMHYSILNLQLRMRLDSYPRVALHGHGLASEDQAIKLKIPCSPEETTCSTREDTAALVKLTMNYKYPEHRIFIRKNHGYYILGEDVDECINLLKQDVVKHL